MARILLSAYACEPDKGSEPAVGWMWATELAAAGHEVWVITRTSNRPRIADHRRSRGDHHLHFVYCDLPPWASQWKRLPGGIYLYYFIWQWLAFRTARRLHRARPFDCVHHITFVSLRAPSFMGWLGIPFYLGPVSGGECVPPKLRESMSFPARLLERLRDVANWLVPFDPLMRIAFHRAQRIYLASRESLKLVPPHYHHKCEIQLAVGLTREQLGFSRRSRARCGPELRCLYVGRLLEWKGIDIALRAIEKLKKANVPMHLTLIGDGPARSRLQRRAQQLGIADNLTWIPWLPHPQAQRRYDDHDVFLFPSLRDSGGMAVLEALAHGLPVVCLGLGGPAAIVTPRCGRTISVQNKAIDEVAAALSGELAELGGNRGLRQSLSIGARRRAWEFEFTGIVRRIYSASTVPDEALAEVASA